MMVFEWRGKYINSHDEYSEGAMREKKLGNKVNT